jgi:TatA/E family protein of Tat protein translocase
VLSLSPIKLIVIAAVIMLLMGPDKLPEVAQKLGAGWRTLKKLQERVESEVREAIPDLPSTGDIARMVRSPVNLLNQMADRVDAKDAAEAKAASTTDLPKEVVEAINEPPPLLTSPPLPTPPRSDEKSPPFDPSLN